MKIVTVIGARPQFIKAAVVSREFLSSEFVEEIIIHTGQHFDENMSDVFFKEMSIPTPSNNLEIHGLSHGAMTGQMLEKIEDILVIEKPDWVLIYGDTNSTLAGALAAKKLNIKVAHVEAGLRSYNMKMPEEVNRILTDRISNILFCPTDKAMENLALEGYGSMDIKVIKCGDVMQDAAFFYADKAKKPMFDIPKNFILCTVHRAENTEDIIRLSNIFQALDNISGKIKIIFPLHPRTKAKLIDIGYVFSSSNISFVTPLGYLEMVYLLKNCEMVITDSGGLQKEAYFFAKNCLTLRDETEWIELVNNGFNLLAGSEFEKILDGFNQLINKKNDFTNRLYGDGNAAEKILHELLIY